MRTVIDFEKGCFATCSSRMALVSADTQDKLLLEIQELPAFRGTELICLQAVFLKERNRTKKKPSQQIAETVIQFYQNVNYRFIKLCS